MRRSLLFIPGNNPGNMNNADIMNADAIIFDLEDSVAVTEKDAARLLVNEFLASQMCKASKYEKIVRINGMDTIYGEKDVKGLNLNNLDTILLPKSNNSNLDMFLKCLKQTRSEQRVNKEIKYILLVEEPRGILDLSQMIEKKPVADGIFLGAEDLTSLLGIKRTKSSVEIEYPRNQVIYASKAIGVDAIDTPFTDTFDKEGLIEDIKHAKAMGMTTKACIHPSQVKLVNELFMPDEEEIRFANRVLAAKEKATKEGKAVFSLDGKMIDKPIILKAEKILEKLRLSNEK